MIFIDLDETLWLTVSLASGYIFLNNNHDYIEQFYYMNDEEREEMLNEYAQGVVIVNTVYGRVANRLNPQAKSFIRSCQQIAPTALFTYGEHELQDPIEQMHELGVKLYSIGEQVPQDKTSVLIDNNPAFHVHCRHKLSELGIGKDRLVQVEDYDGSLFAKNLLTYVPQVKQLKGGAIGNKS